MSESWAERAMARTSARVRARLDALTPAQALFLLSPLLGEVVSGYLSPIEFLNPLILIITVVPYGCGALLIRETIVRWRRGWISLVLLGLAFGLFFEGIVTRVLFNPDWQDLGAVGEYAHVRGFTWTMAVGIVHFQAAVSIIAAILLAHMIYPERRAEPWISTRALAACALAVPGWTLVIGLFEPYVPPAEGLLPLLGLVALLIALARVIPQKPISQRDPAWPAWTFSWIAGLSMTLIMVGTYALPEARDLRPPMEVTFVALLGLMILEFALLTWANNGGASWSDRHRLALVIGWLAFFVAFCILQDLEGFAGRSLVALGTIWQLRRLWRRIGPSEAGADAQL